MKNTGKLFPDSLGLDLKGMTPTQRKVLYYNMLFPGMGFVYAGDLLRSMAFGGGAMGFLFLGFGLIWQSARIGNIRFDNLSVVLAVPIVCFFVMLVFHLFSILKSPSALISRCSAHRAVLYTTISTLLAMAGMVATLAAVWHSVPWQ